MVFSKLKEIFKIKKKSIGEKLWGKAAKEEIKAEKEFEKKWSEAWSKSVEKPKGFKEKIKEGWKSLKSKVTVKCCWPACNEKATKNFGGYWFCNKHAEEIAKDPNKFNELKQAGLIKQERAIYGIGFKWIFLLIILPIIAIIALFGIPFFSNIIGSIGFPISSNQLCMVSCIAGNILNVESWYKAGGIGKYCQEVVCRRVEVINLGCIDCFKPGQKVLRSLLIPGAEGSVSIFINVEKNPLCNSLIGKDSCYCITLYGKRFCEELPSIEDVNILTYSNDIEFVGKVAEQWKKYCQAFSNEISCSMIPTDNLPSEFIFTFNSTCKSSLDWKYTFSYKYTTTGFVSMNVKNPDFKGKPTYYEPMTTPGPLVVGISSLLGKSFLVGIDKEVPLTIGIANKGMGDARLEKVTLSLLNPDENVNIGKIGSKGCRPRGENKGGFIEFGNINALLKSGRDYFIDCILDLSNVNIKDQKTYIFVANATYTYSFPSQRGDSIYVDTIHYDCDLIRSSNWFGIACTNNEVDCVNNINNCYNNENDCDKIIVNEFSFSFRPTYIRKCVENDCTIFFQKELRLLKDAWLNISVTNSTVECKYDGDSTGTIDENTIDENCECIKFKKDDLGNIIGCEKYKYNKCVQISKNVQKIKCKYYVKKDVAQDATLHINSK